jgi:hypothetical protein
MKNIMKQYDKIKDQMYHFVKNVNEQKLPVKRINNICR